MKKTLFTLVALALVSCNQTKIGYVDFNELMEKYEPKIALQTSFESKNEKFNKKRDSLAQAFKLEEQALQSKLNSLSQKKANEEIGLYQKKTNFFAQQLQQELQFIQNESQVKLDSMVKQVKGMIGDYAKKNGYQYILTKSDNAGVIYGDEASDLTNTLITEFNK